MVRLILSSLVLQEVDLITQLHVLADHLVDINQVWSLIGYQGHALVCFLCVNRRKLVLVILVEGSIGDDITVVDTNKP